MGRFPRPWWWPVACGVVNADPPSTAAPSPAPAAVVADDLVVRYGTLTAVAGVSLTANAGEVLAVLGPNGAGKTTTVETLVGYRRPDAGTARVLGLDPVADHARMVRSIGVMPQSAGLPSLLRVAEAVQLFASYYDDPLDADELIDRVGLGERRRSPWRALSGGERQRLSLALALVGRPRVAFLDEPTAGIDPTGRTVVRSMVDDLRTQGVAVVLTTHDLTEAERLADRIAIMDRGQVVASGTLAELTTGAGPAADAFSFTADAGLDTAGLATAIGGPVTEGEPGRYQVAAAPTPARLADLTGWLATRGHGLRNLDTGGSTLEDVFARLTGDGNEP